MCMTKKTHLEVCFLEALHPRRYGVGDERAAKYSMFIV